MKLLEIPSGFFDPVLWRNRRWIITKIMINKGRRKWKEKNRVRVALLMENPPQSHSTIVTPRYGTVVIRLVMTVAPQKDICPQGRTYPRKAVAIDRIKMVTPAIHVYSRLNE